MAAVMKGPDSSAFRCPSAFSPARSPFHSSLKIKSRSELWSFSLRPPHSWSTIFEQRGLLGEDATRRTLTSFAGRSSVSRCTHTCAILWRAGSAVLAGAAERTVGSPEALWAHVITVDSCGHITMTNMQ